ncbi:MAG: hypothetical protein KKB21_04525 [Nanoarchaeota archaeon]|nr:hypothetical protein [Nanoarchaeota archaeon]MBU4086811.1 hypothetical protein [Nanoarchaeota archaeon]
MYKTKRVKDEVISSDREFRILSTMLSPEEMDVVRFFKYKNDLRERWEED